MTRIENQDKARHALGFVDSTEAGDQTIGPEVDPLRRADPVLGHDLAHGSANFMSCLRMLVVQQRRALRQGLWHHSRQGFGLSDIFFAA